MRKFVIVGLVLIALVFALSNIPRVEADDFPAVSNEMAPYTCSGLVTVGDDHVLVSNERHGLYCLDCKTGQPVWQFHGAKIGAVTVLADAVYFVGDGGQAYALSVKDGKIKWQTTFDKGDTIIQMVMIDDGALICTGSHSIFGLSISNGKKVFEHQLPQAPNAALLYEGKDGIESLTGHGYLGYGDGACDLFVASKIGIKKTSLPSELSGWVLGSLPNVFILNHHDAVIAIDPATTKLLWKHPKTDKEPSSWLNCNLIVIHKDDTTFHVQSLNLTTGASLWQFDAPKKDGTNMSYEFAGNLYLFLDSNLYVLDAKSGRLISSNTSSVKPVLPAKSELPAVLNVGWNVEAISPTTAEILWKSPMVKNDSLLATTSDAVLYASKMDGFLHACDRRSGSEKWKFQFDSGAKQK